MQEFGDELAGIEQDLKKAELYTDNCSREIVHRRLIVRNEMITLVESCRTALLRPPPQRFVTEKL